MNYEVCATCTEFLSGNFCGYYHKPTDKVLFCQGHKEKEEDEK